MIEIAPYDLLSRLQTLYGQCPNGMDAFAAWIESTPYGSVTLRFADGVLQVVERTESAK